MWLVSSKVINKISICFEIICSSLRESISSELCRYNEIYYSPQNLSFLRKSKRLIILTFFRRPVGSGFPTPVKGPFRINLIAIANYPYPELSWLNMLRVSWNWGKLKHKTFLIYRSMKSRKQRSFNSLNNRFAVIVLIILYISYRYWVSFRVFVWQILKFITYLLIGEFLGQFCL